MSTSKQSKPGGWGSLFSNAVANLESRLDTILAEDADASARERAAEKAKKDALAQNAIKAELPGADATRTSAQGTGEVSGTKRNDRLAERLAKVTAQKSASQNTSTVPSRVGTPVIVTEDGQDDAPGGVSGEDSKQVGAAIVEPSTSKETNVTLEVDGSAKGNVSNTLPSSGPPSTLARPSTDSSRPSFDLPGSAPSSRQSVELGAATALYAKSELPMSSNESQVNDENTDTGSKWQQEEMHMYLEKIDALQAKLQYLARETVAAAKEANAAVPSGSEKAMLAQKDEKIALLMEEGEKLSKGEMRHLQTIKKLRAKAAQDERAASDSKKKLDQLVRSETDLKHKLQRAETAQRQAEEKSKQIESIAKEVDELKSTRDSASDNVRKLAAQLKEASARAEQAERAHKEALSKPSEVEKKKAADLQVELENARIEKKLSEDRAKANTKKLKEEMDQQKQAFSLRELEYQAEVASLESRLETFRTRAEEASSEGVVEGGSVKLMRQVETLQSQYALAKENWETIEASLNSRVSTLEQEREEIGRRESELRKRTRELTARCRKAEDDLEASLQKNWSLVQDVKTSKEELHDIQEKHDQAQTNIVEAKSELDRQRKLWESEMQQRIEDEKARWRANPSYQNFASGTRLTESPTHSRKGSLVMDPALIGLANRKSISRPVLQEMGSESPRLPNRRSSGMPGIPPRSPQPPSFSRDGSPALSRHESQITLDLPPGSVPATPSIEVDRDFDSSSPQRTINDLVSTSTAGAGPSVQLVERLSTAVRRLESEKATFKDELARLVHQRDDARNEIVTLMREVEAKRDLERRAAEVEDVRKRYEASLEMLGEREEEVLELKQDVAELKRMYKELVEDKFQPGAK